MGYSVSQYENKNEYQRQWRAANKDKVKQYDVKRKEEAREGNWKRRYGIDRETYNKMLSSQDCKCAICLTDTIGRGHKYFHVDHCHSTGKVRGLLCDKCNRGLGYFNDDIKALTEATRYLTRAATECLRYT